MRGLNSSAVANPNPTNYICHTRQYGICPHAEVRIAKPVAIGTEYYQTVTLLDQIQIPAQENPSKIINQPMNRLPRTPIQLTHHTSLSASSCLQILWK